MKNELQILVDELQREHDYLEDEMNSCIKEWDFVGAEAFQKSLIYNKQKLGILKNLENPNFDKINGLKRRIEHLNASEIQDEISKFTIERMRANIPELETELKRLEQIKPKFEIDSDKLIICLEQILSGDLIFFELEIKENELSIEIKKDDNSLEISLTTMTKEPINYYTINYGINELNRIGFTINESNAVLKIDNFESSKISFIIEILSRIIYDVFRLYGNKQAKIKY